MTLGVAVECQQFYSFSVFGLRKLLNYLSGTLPMPLHRIPASLDAQWELRLQFYLSTSYLASQKLGRWGKDHPHDITLIEELNRSLAEKGHESWPPSTKMPPPMVRSLTCALRPNPRAPYMRVRPPQVISLVKARGPASDLFYPSP
jgi:hypothetical protein